MTMRLLRNCRLTVITAIAISAIFARSGAAQIKPASAMESRLRALEDREEIHQLLLNYGRTLDRRDFVAFSRLFADDAEYAGGAADAVKGPSAIAKVLEETFRNNPTGVRTPNYHLFANEIIQVRGNEATAVSKGLFVVPNAAKAPQIEMMASYDDILVRDRSVWKFKKRVVHAEIPYFPAIRTCK
jgi:hypothetical protein